MYGGTPGHALLNPEGVGDGAGVDNCVAAVQRPATRDVWFDSGREDGADTGADTREDA